MKKSKAAFIDRDGVINVDSGYVYRPEDLKLIDKAPEALITIKNLGYKLIVVTNQSGVGRGHYNLYDVYAFHRLIQKKLLPFKVQIDGFYICPHHKEANDPHFLQACHCRKPLTGLPDLAICEHNISLENSFFIGDKTSDVECGLNLGIKTFQVHGQYELHKNTTVVASLYEAAQNLSQG